MLKRFFLLSTILFAGKHALSQNFYFDSSFAVNGTFFNYGLKDFVACLIQPDNKILVNGIVSSNSIWQNSVLCRLNPNGSPDITFGNGGTVINNQLNFAYSPENFVLQADGKIVICGTVSLSSGRKMGIVRYNSNGSLDNSFGINGLKTISFNSFSNDEVGSVKVLPDGKLIVVGSTLGSNLLINEIALIKLMNNGDYDLAFGNAGVILSDFNNDGDFAESVKIYPDGKILIVGWGNNTHSECVIFRYDSNGILDNSFNSNGKLNLNLPFINYQDAFTTSLQSDGKILISHTSVISGNLNFSICRLNDNGSLDYSFNNTGVFYSNPNSSGSETIQSSYLMSNDKIILVGYLTLATFLKKIKVIRLTKDGFLDSTFNSNGLAEMNHNSLSSIGRDISVDSGGKMVVVGYNEDKAFVSKFVINNTVLDISSQKIVFDFFPNPVTEFISIVSNIEKIKSVVVKDVLGTEVTRSVFDDFALTFSLKHLSKGTYFIDVKTENTSESRKIVIQN